MRFAFLLVASMVAAAPAMAQRTVDPRTIPARREMVPSPHQLSSRYDRGLVCLTELSTGRDVCLSRERWRDVAARIARGEPWR